MIARISIFTGEVSGEWPPIGTQFDAESIAYLMELRDLLISVEASQTTRQTFQGYLPEYERVRSAQRQRAIAYLWELLDAPVPVEVARPSWQSEAA